MDCFQDFCLACDKQSNGPYCSQQCRLADLERATPSAPVTPGTPATRTNARLSWSSQTSTSSPSYALTPAYEFNDKLGGSHRKANEDLRTQDSYFMRSPVQQSPPRSTVSGRSITPSSSRSSLSSTMSTGTSTGGISQQARAELDSYFSSFSQAKAAKRRPSTK